MQVNKYKSEDLKSAVSWLRPVEHIAGFLISPLEKFCDNICAKSIDVHRVVKMKPTTRTHFSPGINRVIHDRDPAFKGSDLEEGKIRHGYIVKVDRRVDPFGSVFFQAGDNIGSNLMVHSLQGGYTPTLHI